MREGECRKDVRKAIELFGSRTWHKRKAGEITQSVPFVHTDERSSYTDKMKNAFIIVVECPEGKGSS